MMSGVCLSQIDFSYSTLREPLIFYKFYNIIVRLIDRSVRDITRRATRAAFSSRFFSCLGKDFSFYLKLYQWCSNMEDRVFTPGKLSPSVGRDDPEAGIDATDIEQVERVYR